MASPLVISRVVDLLPELSRLRGVEQPPEHCWDAFDHTVETVRALDRLLARAATGPTGEPRLSPVLASTFAQHLDLPLGGMARLVVLRLAALLHDVGKPAAKAIVDGRIRFPGHADLGAELSVIALQRLGFEAPVVDRIALVIAQHMRPWQIVVDFPPTDHAVRRLANLLGTETEDVLLVSLADHVGMRGPRLEADGWARHLSATEHVLERVDDWRRPAPPRLIDGDELMHEFGLPPGPAVGELLRAIGAAQAEGTVRTRAEALQVARQRLEKP